MEDTARTAGGKLGEFATLKGERSAADLLRDIITNVQEIVRSEVRLARAEVLEETSKTLDAAKKLGIAAVAGLFGLGFILAAVALLLGQFMPGWLATLLVGGALAVLAAVLYSNSKDKIHIPKPEKTIENVKENVEWMKNQTKS
jgi:uncharacterized membrane protein YqjE